MLPQATVFYWKAWPKTLSLTKTCTVVIHSYPVKCCQGCTLLDYESSNFLGGLSASTLFSLAQVYFHIHFFFFKPKQSPHSLTLNSPLTILKVLSVDDRDLQVLLWFPLISPLLSQLHGSWCFHFTGPLSVPHTIPGIFSS